MKEYMLKPPGTVVPSPIALGRTAEVFLWDDTHILKLYYDWCPSDWTEYEAYIARAVHEAGIPSPAVGEILEVNGRRGLIYERLEGISMLQDMNARPWSLWKHARSLADLHVKISQQTIPDLPLYKDRLRYDIRSIASFDEALAEKALALLDRLPEGKNLCHGDYHPGNVLITPHGPVVIDWVTASMGSPWTDVARTSLLLSIGAKGAGKQVSPIIRTAIKLYHRAYLGRYRSLRPDTEDEAGRWTAIIAAARLSENIIPEREALIRIVKEALKD